jgi:hypothetical protein
MITLPQDVPLNFSGRPVSDSVRKLTMTTRWSAICTLVKRR